MSTTVTVTVYGLCLVVREEAKGDFHVVGVPREKHEFEVWIAGLCYDHEGTADWLKERCMSSSGCGTVFRLSPGSKVILSKPDRGLEVGSRPKDPMSLEILGLGEAKSDFLDKPSCVAGQAKLPCGGTAGWYNRLGCFDVKKQHYDVADYFAWGGGYSKSTPVLTVTEIDKCPGRIGLYEGPVNIGIGCVNAKDNSDDPFSYIKAFKGVSADLGSEPNVPSPINCTNHGFNKHITSPSCPPIDGGTICESSED